VALDQLPAAALHQLEHFRRLAAHVANEGRLDFLGVALHTGEQLMQRIKDIGGGSGGNPI
jgi:hypothetical protein